MTTTTKSDPQLREQVTRALARRSFCVLATASPAGEPHAVGVLYAPDHTTLYVHTFRDTRKARNVAANPYVAVCVPVRRLPVGPAMAVQFRGRAEIVEHDDPEIARLIQSGRLRKILVDGALEDPRGCFLRITPAGRVSTYGIGIPLRQVLRDPLSAIGSVSLTSDT
jgi:nitroimidazol reductase NimA-like FMN-containing flavoprotein (pyridoxamine 5'-phosphate oxidase superfamily)